jgi:heptosyltransferase-3
MGRPYQILLVKPAGFDFVEGFREVMESLQEGFRELGFSVPILENRLIPGATPIIFGAHHLDTDATAALPPGSIIYNLEQLMPGYPWFVPSYLELLRRHVVWDFSERNIRYLQDSGISPNARLVPITYSPCLSRIKPVPQDIDVLFFGIQTPRRLGLIAELRNAGLDVAALSNVWGAERDAWIARAKVVLNTHAQDGGEFEIVRIIYLLANRKAVVCEVDDPDEVPADLCQGVIPARLADLVSACLAAVRHEGIRNVAAIAGFHAVNQQHRRSANVLRKVLGGEYRRRAEEDAPSVVRTVAIATAGQLGDLLACEPVIRYLRRKYPVARISLIADQRYAHVMDHHPDLSDIVPISGLNDCITQANSGPYELVVDLNLDRWGCHKTGQILRKPSQWLPVNGDNYYLFGPLLTVFSLAAGLPPLVDAPQLHIDTPTHHKVDALGLPDRYMVLHCLSSEAERNWDDQKWLELASMLNEDMHLPLFEVGLTPIIDSSIVESRLCGRLSLLETAEVIRRATCFVGIDSGPAHMAVAAETPTVVLAGGFRQFSAYFPYTGRFAQSEGLYFLLNTTGPAKELHVNDVHAAVRSQLAFADRRLRHLQ